MKKKKNYYRTITERLPQDLFRFSLFFLCLSFVAFLLFVVYLFQAYEKVKYERQGAIDSLSYWESVVLKQPNSPDAYYQAGIYAAKLGESQKAIGFLDKAVKLDPSFKKANSLSQQLTQRPPQSKQ